MELRKIPRGRDGLPADVEYERSDAARVANR